MNLFELFVKVGVDDQASGKLKDLGSKLGNGLKTAAKIGTAAVSAAAAGITAMTTAAVKNYAEYEQLVGGVDTLFKKSSKKVQKYASEAYKTAGMSANDYMSTVTSFSASLLQSLGGDTEKAADYANRALTDMSDNANKMGTSMELIQNAYQGFAKQNYTMLDNLKLGYGGTATEMARLINDSGVLGDKMIDLGDKQNIGAALAEVGFAKMTEAIHVVQTEMGITGTTALEAGRTISGSVGSMKAAWDNLITGLADKNADLKTLVNDLVTTIVGDGTDKNLGVFGNIKPAIETALEGAVELVKELFPQIVEMLPPLLEQTIPNLVSSALSVVEAIIDAISDNSSKLSESVVGAITSILLHAAENTPKLIGGIITLILSLIKEIGKNLGTIIPALIASIVDIITEIASRTPELTDAIFAVIDGIVNALTSPEGIVKMTVAGFKLLVGLISGIVGSVPKLIGNILMIIPKIVDSFLDADWKGVGKNIVDGIWGGLKNAWENLKKWFTDAWENLVGGVKDLLGIKSPSRVFAEIGKNMALGVGVGWDDEFGDVENGINRSMSFDDAAFGVSYYGHHDGVLGDVTSGGGISIIQNIYSEAKTAADLMAEAMYHQEKAVYIGV